VAGDKDTGRSSKYPPRLLRLVNPYPHPVSAPAVSYLVVIKDFFPCLVQSVTKVAPENEESYTLPQLIQMEIPV
jgi:hypothetical protein